MKNWAVILHTWLDKLWMAQANTKWQPLVKLMDLLWSDCPYCMAYRGAAVGLAVGLAVALLWKIALAILLLVAVLVLIERYGKVGP